MQIHQLMDACIVALSFWLAFELRNDERIIAWLNLPPVPLPFDAYVWLYLLLIPAAPLILEAQGFYSRPMVPSRRTTWWMLFKSCGIMTLGLIIGLFVLQMIIARWTVVWFGFISFALLLLKEELLRWAIQTRVARSQYRRRLLLIGPPEETRRMRIELRNKSQEDVEVVMELELTDATPRKLAELLHEHSVNGVIVSAKHAYFQQVEIVIRSCEVEGVEACLLAEFFGNQISRTSFDDFYGRPMLVFRCTPEASWQGVMKALLDFVVALVLLVVLVPTLFLVVAVIIKLTSPGPILFRQQRSGLNGRPFTLYKFRTMVTNAEQLKHELAVMNEMSGPVFKVTNDPRVTRIGRFLRKFSIDEFPQLYNVLRGEMSLVGPRPLPVDEVKRFDDLAHRRRLSVKPGLTCLWQVSGRNDVSDFRDWVRLDLEYIDNWSLWLDFKILCRTVPVVLTGAGSR